MDDLQCIRSLFCQRDTTYGESAIYDQKSIYSDFNKLSFLFNLFFGDGKRVVF